MGHLLIRWARCFHAHNLRRRLGGKAQSQPHCAAFAAETLPKGLFLA